MRIAIVTDCWHPQIDGIVRTLEHTLRELSDLGHDVLLLTPLDFTSLPLPYGDRLVLPWYPRLASRLTAFHPDTVHLATQGLLCLTAKLWCLRNRAHWTTAFHTRFPEYANVRFGLPLPLLYKYARLFHGTAAPVLVPSEALADDLRKHGIGRPKLWLRGVDTERFHPAPKTLTKYERPILLYAGRVVLEKNVEAFLSLDTVGTKIVAGSGPLLPAVRARYPQAVFLGELDGETLARSFREADVFVFPSLLDTFGLVVLEALASGVPVAAFKSRYLVEIFDRFGAVAFDDDLGAAITRALRIPPDRCRDAALAFSWRACTEQFLAIIEEDRTRQ